MVKKIIRKKVSDSIKTFDIKNMSIADLFALYAFVAHDANNRGFGLTSPEARTVVRDKKKEIEEELYLRTYGFNPFEKFKMVFEGTKPEDVDLDRFVVSKPNTNIEEAPDQERFVVAKNKER